MSKIVDERVVEMQFDNERFERNVRATMSTLEKLKNSLRFDKSVQEFSNLDKAVDKVSFEPLLSSIAVLQNKFSVFGTASRRIVENLTDSIMNRVSKTFNYVSKGINWITTSVIEGGKRRATNIENAHFQLQGLLKDEDKVQAIMDDAMDSVDGTAYAFDEAAKAASQLAASGLDAGPKLQSALRAITGVAAMTNSEYSVMADIFTTVAGNGRLMGDQLNQLAGRGLNAASTLKDFFNGVIDGSIEASDSVTNAIKTVASGLEVSEQDIREYVSKGKISFEIFAEAMDYAFGEHAKKANETLNGAFSNMKSALSRIGALFISPLVEQNGELVELLNSLRIKFNDIKGEIGPLADLFTNFVKSGAAFLKNVLDSLDIKTPVSILVSYLDRLKNINFETVASPIINFVKKIKDYIDYFKSNAKMVDQIKTSVKGLLALLSILKNIVVAFVKPIRVLFFGADSGILEFTSSVGNLLIRTKDALEQFGFFEKLSTRLSGIFSTLNRFIKDAIELFNGTFYKASGGGIVGIIDSLIAGINGLVRAIFGIISVLTGKDLDNIQDRILAIIWKIRSGIVEFVEKAVIIFNKVKELLVPIIISAWEAIKPVLLAIKDLFSGSVDAIKNFFNSLKSIDFKPASDLSEKTEKAFSPLKVFFDGLKKLFQGIGQLFVALKPIFAGIISAIGRVLGVIGNAIGEIVRNFNFSKLTEILSGGLKVGIGVKIFEFIKSLKKSADSAGGMLSDIKEMFGGLKELFGNFSEMMDAKTLETKSKALKNIAIAIGILAASLFVLSSIEPHKLQASMTAITVLVSELVGAMALLSKINKKVNLKKIGQAMIGMAAAVLVLSLAVKAIGSLQPDQITAGLLAITILMGEMVVAAKILSDDGKSKKMMKSAANSVIFAVALRVLVSSVKALGKMQPAQLVNGMIGVTILIAEMVAAAKILGNGKDSSSMMKGALNAVIFAVALRVLVSSVKSLGKLQPEQLINGMIGVTILIAEMIVAAKILGNSKETSSMMKGAVNAVIFAAALKILVSSVKGLGQMQPDQLITGLVGMAAVLTEMIAAMKLMSMAKGGAGSMIAAAAAMMVLALSLKVLGALSWEQLGKGLLAIAGAFTILGVAGYVLGPVVGTILALSGAMALMGVSAVMFGAGMLMISAAFAALGGSTLIAVNAIIAAIISLIVAIPEMITALAKSLQESGTSIITCLVEVARAALIALKEIVPEAVDVVLELILTTLSSLAENIQPIIESLLDIVVGVINGLAEGTPEIITATINLLKSVIDSIMGAFDGLSLADLLEASAALALFGVMMGELAVISVLAMVAVLPLPLIGAKLSQFIEATEPFLTRIQEVNPASLQGAKALAEMILILTANGILDALTSWFTGGSSMVDFGKQLAEFAPYMKRYSDSIKGMDNAVVESSANAALALATMASNLPNSGGVASWFAGENSLSAFADELVKFGPKLKQYADSVTGLNAGVVINSVIAARVLSNFAENLPNSGGVVSWFTGDNSLSVFADELAIFGPKLKAYADSVSGMDTSIVIQSMNAAKAISEFAENLPNSGGVVSWFTGDNTISKFGEGLSEFGTSLANYYDTISGINVESITAIIPGIQSLVGVAQDISSLNIPSISSFAEAFIQLATDGVNGLVNTFVDSTVDITDAVDGTLQSVLDSINDREKDFSDAGKTLINELIAAIKIQMPKAKSTLTSGINNMTSAIKAYYIPFKSAATYLVDGFVKGINENTWKVEAESRAMAKAAADAAREELDENSPSKVFYSIADYGVIAFANAFLEGRTKAYKSGTSLAEASIKGTSDAIRHLASIVNSDIDLQPTIRPVMDLTDVRTKTRQLNAMLSTRHAYSIGASMDESNSDSSRVGVSRGNTYNFTQNNYSPKALSSSEIYRQTKNQFSLVKERIGKR